MESDIRLEAVHFYWIERVNRAAKDLTRKVFQEQRIPLTVEQWVLIKRIAEEPGLNQKALSDQTYKEPAAVTRTLALLVKQGYLAKKVDTQDRRNFLLHLTESGEEIYERALPLVREMRATGLVGFDPTDQDQFRIMLQRMCSNLEQANQS